MEVDLVHGARVPGQLVPVGGHQRSSEVMRGTQRPSEAIRGHQRPSEAIRGHQRPMKGHQAYEMRRVPTSHT